MRRRPDPSILPPENGSVPDTGRANSDFSRPAENPGAAGGAYFAPKDVGELKKLIRNYLSLEGLGPAGSGNQKQHLSGIRRPVMNRNLFLFIRALMCGLVLLFTITTA